MFRFSFEDGVIIMVDGISCNIASLRVLRDGDYREVRRCHGLHNLCMNVIMDILVGVGCNI